MAGGIVIQTINIAVVVPMPPVFMVAAVLFIVALRSQEAAPLPEAEPLAARMWPTVVVADAVGNQ
jgi:hypothetical protein